MFGRSNPLSVPDSWMYFAILLCLVITWRYSRLPVTRTLHNANLPLTRSNHFPSNSVSVKSKLQHAPLPPGIPRAFDTFAVPGRREFDYQNLLGGGEFELHHVKSLAWRPIMGDAVLEDFRGKDCAFVANCLRGKGLNKLCAVFEVFKF